MEAAAFQGKLGFVVLDWFKEEIYFLFLNNSIKCLNFGFQCFLEPLHQKDVEIQRVGQSGFFVGLKSQE